MKLDQSFPRFVKALVREYVANEIMREISGENNTTVVRVLGEVLANKPGMSELVHVEMLAIARELSEGTSK